MTIKPDLFYLFISYKHKFKTTENELTYRVLKEPPMYNLLRYIHLAYLKGGHSKRYKNLFKLIYSHRCKTIIEIGTNRAKNAVRMINTAKVHSRRKDIQYYGFDLFEDLSEVELRNEFSKMPSAQQIVEEKLTGTGVHFKVNRGYTQQKLPEFISYAKNNGITADFIFIDGGHAVETIASDWENVRQLLNDKTVVVFDDYYRNNEPEIKGFGCNKIIESLDRNIYESSVLLPEDSFTKHWGVLNISLAKVMLKKNMHPLDDRKLV